MGNNALIKQAILFCPRNPRQSNSSTFFQLTCLKKRHPFFAEISGYGKIFSDCCLLYIHNLSQTLYHPSALYIRELFGMFSQKRPHTLYLMHFLVISLFMISVRSVHPELRSYL